MCSLLVGSGLIRVRQGKFGTGVLFLSVRGNGKWIVRDGRVGKVLPHMTEWIMYLLEPMCSFDSDIFSSEQS
jgi:hypothetical protein